LGTPILVAGIAGANVTLTSPYALPFRVMYPHDLGSGPRDLTLRVHLAETVSTDAVETLDSTVIPFLLMVSSGALAGESIPPWTSTVDSWEDPVTHSSTVEWSLRGVTCDPQAWVMLAQMLLVDHRDHPIVRIEIAESSRRSEMTYVVTGMSRFNPYPNRWAEIRFPIEFYEDVPNNFTVYAGFTRPLSDDDTERIDEELSAWAPGLMLGAYGVAPVPPDKCTGFPDEDIVFLDNALEWQISRFRAHTGAIEGLINVLASISQKVVQVTEVRVE
jgi:hypothetical protein